MGGKIKFWQILIIIVGSLFFLNNNSFAHPGNTDSFGCHTCRTNCPSWGLYYGEYHCHNSGSNYIPVVPVTPDCPYNSYYDSISTSCKCYSGYIASGGQCISTDQYCRNKYGFNSRYNILTDSCECGYGYVLSGGSCVDGDTLCHQKYGYSSSYDSLTDKCKCNYGYIFNSLNQCVSKNDYCYNLYGFNSEYNILSDKCVCKKGYFFDDAQTKCVDGTTYCRNKFGSYTGYDYLSDNCKCDSGYVLSGNRCVDGNIYCQNLYGEQSSYNSISKICECNYGYELKNNKCATPIINNIYPLEAKIGDEVIIRGENFGDSKYGSLKLYIGFAKVNSLDISTWQDDKIVFEITDDLESGNVILKNDSVNIRGSYLEISETEQNNIYIPPIPAVDNKPITPTTTTVKNQPKSEVKSVSTKSEPEGLRATSEEKKIDIKNKQETEETKPAQLFLANISTAIKNFFSRIFKW